MAKDTPFIALKDETGHINLSVWTLVAQCHRQVLLSARLLQVSDRLQHQAGVMQV